MSRPLDVAFVWHMHQPYYRSASTGAFAMPWARMHALKDYLDMVHMLEGFPALHQTFNLVPSLVEQLEDYASGDYQDVYWQHSLKPAAGLEPPERAFLLERMCDHADHPRARSHPRYLELAQKRDSLAAQGWESAANTFTTQELLDMQIWFNLAWFGRRTQTDEALRGLVERGRDFREEDKRVLAERQAAILENVLPAYRDAASRGQVELTTSPYFHPILPLLCDTDSARISSPDLKLPPRRFAHPEDAAEQLREASAKHREVFGSAPLGVWCSEMALGEAVIPLLTDAGFEWTISDEGLLSRSVNDVTARPVARRPAVFGTPYRPYRLVRETGEMNIVFRDHTLSDLIGFTYRSWRSQDAATDLLARLKDIGRKAQARHGSHASTPLVVIALDGENAWEYYPEEGREFLSYLYEGLSSDESIRCVTVSEHLRESPPRLRLDWLHTGSWIFADLTTWCGTEAHNLAWDQLHQARDLVQRKRQAATESRGSVVKDQSAADEPGTTESGAALSDARRALEAAWRHIQVAEGSDWFWWFSDHHHTELDAVWDLEFRAHLQEVYRLLGEPVPATLMKPLSRAPLLPTQTAPSGRIEPHIDGILSDPAEWDAAGYLTPVGTTAMQPAVAVQVHEVRFGWHDQRLCLMVAIDRHVLCAGSWIELAVRRESEAAEGILRVTLEKDGSAAVEPLREGLPPDSVNVAWRDFVEIAVPADAGISESDSLGALVVRVGRGDAPTEEFHSSNVLQMGAGPS